MKNKNKQENENNQLAEALNKSAGKRIAFLGDDDSIEKVEVIPTGILPLDFAIGIGGIPKGKITNIYGRESVGKSTICYTLIAKAQEQGIQCALVDGEFSFQPAYAQKFGVNTKNLLIIQADCQEEGFEAIETVIRNGYGLVVVDSISSMVPRALAEAEHGKSPMAMQARGISQGLIKILPPLAKNNCAVVMISQMRVNLMAMHHGDKYTVTGGFALKFYSSLIIEMKRLQAITDAKKTLLGSLVGFTVKKNKLARPGGKCEVPYLFDTGFEEEGDLIQMAIEKGLIVQEGAWFTLNGERFHGKEKVALSFVEHPDWKQALKEHLFPET